MRIKQKEMKKRFVLVLITMLALSCNKFDESAIWNKLNDHEGRIAYLEEACKTVNTNIVTLQTIVTALEANDYIINASPLVTGDGYTFTFKSGKSVVVYDGEDGVDGTDGKDGVNGKDGVTPVISVMKDVDGIYYWTVNNQWLLINGEKVRASAIDGKDGENGTDGTNGVNGTDGKDGITPKFKIQDDYWYISYDNGNSWDKLGKASGSNGLNGDDGDSFFKGVSMSDGFVQFTLNDENETIIKVPYLMEDTLVFVSEKPGDVKTKLTNQQKRSVVHLIVEGYIDGADVRYIADQMLALEILDLRKTNLTAVPSYAFCKGEVKYGKDSIREVYLPEVCLSIGSYAFYGCVNLKYIEATGNVSFGSYSIEYCNENLYINVGSADFIGSTKCYLVVDTLRMSATTINHVDKARINHLIIAGSVNNIRSYDTGLFDNLSINSIDFEEPSSIQSINIGVLRAEKLVEFEIPTSVTKIESGQYYSIANGLVKRIIIPENSQLSSWELHPNYMDRIEEIYCYKSTPPTLEYYMATSSKISPTVYVPFKYYSAYSSASIWKDWTIKTLVQ